MSIGCEHVHLRTEDLGRGPCVICADCGTVLRLSRRPHGRGSSAYARRGAPGLLQLRCIRCGVHLIVDRESCEGYCPPCEAALGEPVTLMVAAPGGTHPAAPDDLWGVRGGSAPMTQDEIAALSQAG